jgi:hypothetical protein
MKIIQVASKYLGQKEGSGNTFDAQTPLGKLVKAAGQNNGEAWCAYFAEGVCLEAYPERKDQIQKLFSASAVQTFARFKDAKFVISQYPVLGSIVIWQRFKEGQPTWQGHVGIVSKVISNVNFESIEGNTNSAGSREGDSVQVKKRDTIRKDHGLNVLGFIVLKYE